MPKKLYSITQTVPATVKGKTGTYGKGWIVYVNLLQWNEVQEIETTTLDNTVIDEMVRNLIVKRAGLDDLGNE